MFRNPVNHELDKDSNSAKPMESLKRLQTFNPLYICQTTG